jgi:hypothetical protein
VTSEAGVSIIGYVLLNDHFHWLVDLSPNNKLPDPTPVGQVASEASYLTPRMLINSNPTISDSCNPSNSASPTGIKRPITSGAM